MLLTHISGNCIKDCYLSAQVLSMIYQFDVVIFLYLRDIVIVERIWTT